MNNKEIIVTVIVSTKHDPGTEIMEVPEFIYKVVEPGTNVDWLSTGEIPIFPGYGNEKVKQACFQKMINKHIGKVFRYTEFAPELGAEDKTLLQLTIQKDGKVNGVFAVPIEFILG